VNVICCFSVVFSHWLFFVVANIYCTKMFIFAYSIVHLLFYCVINDYDDDDNDDNDDYYGLA